MQWDRRTVNTELRKSSLAVVGGTTQTENNGEDCTVCSREAQHEQWPAKSVHSLPQVLAEFPALWNFLYRGESFWYANKVAGGGGSPGSLGRKTHSGTEGCSEGPALLATVLTGMPGSPGRDGAQCLLSAGTVLPGTAGRPADPRGLDEPHPTWFSCCRESSPPGPEYFSELK